MPGHFDDAVAISLQRNRTTMETLTDLLKAEPAHRQAASIGNCMTAAEPPMMKDQSAVVLKGSPIKGVWSGR